MDRHYAHGYTVYCITCSRTVKTVQLSTMFSYLVKKILVKIMTDFKSFSYIAYSYELPFRTFLSYSHSWSPDVDRMHKQF